MNFHRLDRSTTILRVRVRQSWTCLSQPSGHHACPLTDSFIQLTTELGKCQHYEIIALKMQELCLNFQKKKFWQGGNPPFNPQKRQKSLRAFFSLGKEIKLKIQGGGKFFKLEERIYTPGLKSWDNLFENGPFH